MNLLKPLAPALDRAIGTLAGIRGLIGQDEAGWSTPGMHPALQRPLTSTYPRFNAPTLRLTAKDIARLDDPSLRKNLAPVRFAGMTYASLFAPRAATSGVRNVQLRPRLPIVRQPTYVPGGTGTTRMGSPVTIAPGPIDRGCEGCG